MPIITARELVNASDFGDTTAETIAKRVNTACGVHVETTQTSLPGGPVVFTVTGERRKVKYALELLTV